MTRAVLFALSGLAFFAFWLVAEPSFDVSPKQGEWPYVLAFSFVILTLALVVPLFAQLVGGRFAFRAALVVASGATLSSAANILEDGLKMEWAFFAFVAGLLIMYAGDVALAFAIVRRGSRWQFALVPAGTMAAFLFYVFAGGPVMLATWLLAAGLALAEARTPLEAVPTSG